MNQRGQASILVAIIFQVVFIFFAMVVNVGLLIHDKINLQNSADIAAYYGAMKQAEVLNAMGHVNYQIRQAWKLLNWRMWALADAGRNADFFNYMQNGTALNLADIPATWTQSRLNNQFYDKTPLVCIHNPLWFDEVKPGTSRNQNLCQSGQMKLPEFKPLPLNPIQALFPEQQMFAALSRKHALLYNSSCSGAGPSNFQMAEIILQSYKIAVNKRRIAMHNLQNLLIRGATSADDFRDISGQPVKPVAELTLDKNLTAANRASVKFEFTNSLSGRPFLVPIDVRLMIKYLDLYDSGGCTATPTDIITPAQKTPSSSDWADIVFLAQKLAAPDYFGTANPSPADFDGEQSDKVFRSLVGFEKNPWMLAYVRVKATSSPRMLFSPMGNGTVTLEAESYAMPFGGKLGPWYNDKWFPSHTKSTSEGNNKVDFLLPPRMGGDDSAVDTLIPPNYSRFPGDALGMKSQLARTLMLAPLFSPTIELRPHFVDDDYANLAQAMQDPRQDPVVSNNAGNTQVRSIEIAALAPDLFDATYYSVNSHFGAFLSTSSGEYFDKELCGYPKMDCLDYGVSRTGGGRITQSYDITNQIQLNMQRTGIMGDQAFWFIRDPSHLNLSWTQESNDTFVSPGGPSKKMGQSENFGGRSGYSVKLVSKRFLERGDLPFGGGGSNIVKGAILNPPSKLATMTP